MKPILEHLPKNAKESFVVMDFEYNYFPTPWHYHPEYELVLVTESTGTRLVGDAIDRFEENNLALLGPNLSHTYKNDEIYFKDNSLKAKSIVIHFSECSFGKNFLDLPETRLIKNLLQNCQNGLDIFGITNYKVGKLLKKIVTQSGLKRLTTLIKILHIISESNEIRQISNQVIDNLGIKESERLLKVFDYVQKFYTKDIKLIEVASLINMTETSFSRFFSQCTRISFSKYLTDFRLNKASTLLQNEKLIISDISFSTGFNNLSNFNRQFKTKYNITPKEYREQFKKSKI